MIVEREVSSERCINQIPACFSVIFIASALLFPPAEWPTALASSFHEGSPYCSIYSATASLTQMSSSLFSFWITSSLAGFSLRASPTCFHLAVTGVNSAITSNKSSMTRDILGNYGYKLLVYTCIMMHKPRQLSLLSGFHGPFLFSISVFSIRITCVMR